MSAPPYTPSRRGTYLCKMHSYLASSIEKANQNFPKHFQHTKLRKGAYRQMFVGRSV